MQCLPPACHPTISKMLHMRYQFLRTHLEEQYPSGFDSNIATTSTLVLHLLNVCSQLDSLAHQVHRV